MKYKSSSYLVRANTLVLGEVASALTFESSEAILNNAIKDAVREIGQRVLAGHVTLNERHQVEILLGATANRIAFLEDLANHCRNLLVDLEGASMSEETRLTYNQIMETLDQEVGV